MQKIYAKLRFYLKESTIDIQDKNFKNSKIKIKTLFIHDFRF